MKYISGIMCIGVGLMNFIFAAIPFDSYSIVNICVGIFCCLVGIWNISVMRSLP